MPTRVQAEAWVRLFAFALLFFWTLFAFCFTLAGWDAIIYHLPFSSYLWNIGGGENTFHMSPLAHWYWIGFPKMGEAIQGLCWKLFGTVHAVVLPNVVLLLIYCRVVKRFLKIPAALVILGFFMNPQLTYHYCTSYIDYLAAAFLVVAFFYLAKVLTNWRVTGEFAGRHFWTAAVFLELAATEKHNIALDSCGMMGLVFIAIFILGKSSLVRRFLMASQVALVGAATLVIPMTDWVLYGNPIYPMKVHAAGIDWPGPVERFGQTPCSFSSFWLSMTELDWAARGVRVVYGLDNDYGEMPLNGPQAITGGWGGATCLYLSGLLLLALVYGRTGRYYRTALGFGGLFFLFMALTPGSAELRYSFPIYLIGMPLAMKWGVVNRGRSVVHLLVILALTAYYQTAFLLSRFEGDPIDIGFNGADYLSGQTFDQRFLYINNNRAFFFSQALTGRAVKISEDPADETDTFSWGDRMDSIRLYEHLHDGWNAFFLPCVAVPNAPTVTLLFRPTENPPASKQKLILEFSAVGTNWSGDLGKISVNNGEVCGIVSTQDFGPDKKARLELPFEFKGEPLLTVRIEGIPFQGVEVPWTLTAVTFQAK